MKDGAHVLVARLDNVGDVLLTGPAVRAVAAGTRRVTFLTSSTGAAAARLLPGVDEIVTFDAPWVAFDAPAVDRAMFDATIERLAALGADQALIATSFHQSPLPLALMLRLAGVPLIAATSVDYPGTLVDVRHAVVEGHEVEQTLSLAGTLGYHLPVDDDGALRLREPLPVVAPFLEPYVVVHPGASVPAHGIPADLAARIVEALVASGWKVVLTGSSGEAALTAQLAAGHDDDVLDLAGHVDLSGLAGVLRGAAALVCGNTGPAHVAAAVGTPVASVFAPVVSAHRWAPWGVPTAVLGDQDVPCAGCRARRCPMPVQDCLAGVTADAVVDAVESIARCLRSATP